MDPRDHSYDTAEEALPNAERYCERDGSAWIMRDDRGRFHIINPYNEATEKHYLGRGWTVSYKLHTKLVTEKQVVSEKVS